MDARVIITNEFKKLANQKITKNQKGKILLERLKKIDESGEISLATNRMELAELIGYPKGSENGRTYINNLVRRGVIKETMNGEGRKYELTGNRPDYSMEYGKLNTKRGHAHPRTKGKENAIKLVELYNSGELAKIRTREELAEAMGYGKTSAGRRWVAGQINRGIIKETLVSYNNGVSLYSYTIKRARVSNLSVKTALKTVKQTAEPVNAPVILSRVDEPAKNRVVIEKDGMKITIDQCTTDFIRDIMK